jgi:hypothetical protein
MRRFCYDTEAQGFESSVICIETDVAERPEMAFTQCLAVVTVFLSRCDRSGLCNAIVKGRLSRDRS